MHHMLLHVPNFYIPFQHVLQQFAVAIAATERRSLETNWTAALIAAYNKHSQLTAQWEHHRLNKKDGSLILCSKTLIYEILIIVDCIYGSLWHDCHYVSQVCHDNKACYFLYYCCIIVILLLEVEISILNNIKKSWLPNRLPHMAVRIPLAKDTKNRDPFIVFHVVRHKLIPDQYNCFSYLFIFFYQESTWKWFDVKIWKPCPLAYSFFLKELELWSEK